MKRKRFSEETDPGFSYTTLRDHAFTVTGVRRLVPPGNVRWEATVEPEGYAEVTIVLPETMDCDDEGAICTGDGRMLSNRLELTVAGPSGQSTGKLPNREIRAGPPLRPGPALP